MAMKLIPEPPGDPSGPPLICGCPVNNPACPLPLTYRAQQCDALLTHLAALELPACPPGSAWQSPSWWIIALCTPGTWPPACPGALGLQFLQVWAHLTPPRLPCWPSPPCCQPSPASLLCQDLISSLSSPTGTLPIPAHWAANGERAWAPKADRPCSTPVSASFQKLLNVPEPCFPLCRMGIIIPASQTHTQYVKMPLSVPGTWPRKWELIVAAAYESFHSL